MRMFTPDQTKFENNPLGWLGFLAFAAFGVVGVPWLVCLALAHAN